MCGGCLEESAGFSRREFLRLGGAGLAGAVLLGSAGGRALARRRSLVSEFEDAAKEYGAPLDLLLAMGYVNTLWEMPPAYLTDYEPGDLHGRGAYGVMQLRQTESLDTLGEAASLTGIPEGKLKEDRASNIRGGAALLADIQGGSPEDVNAWQGAVAEYAGTPLYAEEVYTLLQRGAAQEISTGETLRLRPDGEAEVPAGRELQARGGDYPRAVWRPAYGGNYSGSKRERTYNISRVVIHVVQGSYSSAINWFRDSRAQVSAHYVVNNNGRMAQCVRHKDIAWHAGNWNFNRASIGIEHAGYGSNKNTWTPQMYGASARLTAYITRRHRIPINHRTIIGHRNVPGGTRSCPGPHFSFRRYMNLVRRFRKRMR